MVTIHKYNYNVFMITCKIVFSLLFCLQYNVQRYMFVYVWDNSNSNSNRQSSNSISNSNIQSQC